MHPGTWTDERLNDLAANLRPLPEQVAKVVQAVEHLTDETRALRGDVGAVREDLRFLRADLSETQRQIAHIGWALAGALLAALVALVVVVA